MEYIYYIYKKNYELHVVGDYVKMINIERVENLKYEFVDSVKTDMKNIERICRGLEMSDKNNSEWIGDSAFLAPRGKGRCFNVSEYKFTASKEYLYIIKENMVGWPKNGLEYNDWDKEDLIKYIEIIKNKAYNIKK
jgi:hypothetical protein